MHPKDKAEWNKGFWQADADLKTEGNILGAYVKATPHFRAGYRVRADLKTTVEV